MKKRIAIIGLLVVISGIAIFLLGCPPPPLVRVPPPPARVEVYGAPPFEGAVWIPGYWNHRYGEWVWIPGHWERPRRPNAVWVPGHWEERGGGWIWRPGHWEYR